MNDYDKHKIDAANEHQKRFDPEGYKKRKAAEEELIRSFFPKPKCPNCGGNLARIKDSPLHLVATGTCEDCGFEFYV